MSAARWAARAGVVSGVFCTATGCAGSGPATRDVVPEGHDTVIEAGARSVEGYERVIRRPLAVVGVAGSRGLDPDEAAAAMDHLADAIDACASAAERRGQAIQGSARIVAQIDGGGSVGPVNLRLDPGVRASDAVLCVVAPVKALAFAPSDGGTRGFAVDTSWGRGPAGDAG